MKQPKKFEKLILDSTLILVSSFLDLLLVFRNIKVNYSTVEDNLAVIKNRKVFIGYSERYKNIAREILNLEKVFQGSCQIYLNSLKLSKDCERDSLKTLHINDIVIINKLDNSNY